MLAASAAATALLARLAPRLGWTDAPAGLARKLQRRAVPAVGGAALLLGLALAPAAWWRARPDELWGPWLPGLGWRLATLLVAFAAGTWDDRAPLAPGRKLGLQLLAFAPMAAGAWSQGAPLAALAWPLLGVALLNLCNTFDNADGALAGLAALAFAPVAPLVSAASLGFLPFNLDAARPRNRASGAPSAYLGDAGAYVLAVLVAFRPGAAGLLVLPALDLARLSWARARAGSRPWIGDRRHLAHRLARRGLAPLGVAACLAGIALPACLGVALALARDALAPGLAGIGLTTVLHLGALRAAPDGAASTPPSTPPK